MALEDSRYCYSPAAASANSPNEMLPNSPHSVSRNSSNASSPATTICKLINNIRPERKFK